MRNSLIVVVVLVLAQLALAGGIVTNSNQSAQFVRNLSRNASSEIDAIYFNPAGLTQLASGWHFAVYNQTIMQEKTVNNDFPLLNQNEYVGEVNVPLFPNFYAAFKIGDLALSFGFGPNGGGGTADFADGLPSFELPISSIPLLIDGMGVPTSAYKADISFKGSSVYYGFQLNGSYEISDMFSAAIGVRYISAINTYEGGIKNIQINPTFPALGLNGSFMSAAQFFTALSQVNPAAGLYVDQVQNIDVDVKQTGSAITPLIGVNFKPIDNLNIGLRYELNTDLVLTNETTVDGSGMFPDGEETNADIPAILAVGAEYAFMPQFRGAVSYTYYFDKNANWGGREELVDNNYFELALGLEYDINEAFLISGGFLRAQTGVSEEYQTDMSHSLSSNTIGLGLRYTLAGVWDIDLGGLYTMYDESERKGSEIGMNYIETYNRSNIGIAIGLGYHF